MKHILIFEEFDNKPEFIYKWVPSGVLQNILINGIRFGLNLDTEYVELMNKYPYSISTTHNKYFKYGASYIRFILDKNKIKKNYSVRRYKYMGFFNEFEDRIYSKKPGYLPIDVIIKIECTSEDYDDIIKLKNPHKINIEINDNLLKLNKHGGVPPEWKKLGHNQSLWYKQLVDAEKIKDIETSYKLKKLQKDKIFKKHSDYWKDQ
jgi:hypothetical protein